MPYLLYIFFGLAPSVIWLLFFLRKDSHPESNWMIIRIFIYGMLITIPVAFIEMGLQEQMSKIPFLSPILLEITYFFFGVAFIEELFKYLVVKKKVLGHHEFDEPVDTMLYMIIAALGFAALENLLVLLPLLRPFMIFQTLHMSLIRFLGATFLHALCSGLLGYYMALSFFEPHKRNKLLLKGFFIASGLHCLYNLSIINIDMGIIFFVPVSIIIFLAFFVTAKFKKVKKLKSICLPKKAG